MIRSIKGSATRQFVEQGTSRFSSMATALAYRRLQQINTAANQQALAGLNSVGLHKLKGGRRDFGRSMSTVHGAAYSGSRTAMPMTFTSCTRTDMDPH